MNNGPMASMILLFFPHGDYVTRYFYPSANWKDRDCQGCEMWEIKSTWIVLLLCSLIFRRLFTSWLLLFKHYYSQN